MPDSPTNTDTQQKASVATSSRAVSFAELCRSWSCEGHGVPSKAAEEGQQCEPFTSQQMRRSSLLPFFTAHRVEVQRRLRTRPSGLAENPVERSLSWRSTASHLPSDADLERESQRLESFISVAGSTMRVQRATHVRDLRQATNALERSLSWSRAAECRLPSEPVMQREIQRLESFTSNQIRPRGFQKPCERDSSPKSLIEKDQRMHVSSM